MWLFWLGSIALLLTVSGLVWLKLPNSRLLLILPLLSLSLYSWWGNYSAVANAKRLAAEVHNTIQTIQSPEEIIQRLKDKLNASPNSVQGWLLLGRVYLDLQQYQHATQALAEAFRLQPQEPQVIIQYVTSLFYANHKRLTPKSKALINTVFQLQPGNPEAMNLLALDAYERQDYEQAILRWQQILPDFAATRERQAILDAIQQAQAKRSGAQ